MESTVENTKKKQIPKMNISSILDVQEKARKQQSR